MLSVDDLTPGQHVIIRERQLHEGIIHRSACIVGLPLTVQAIDLPFVLLSDGLHQFAVDCRRCEFMRASAEYVSAWDHAAQLQTAEATAQPLADSQTAFCPNCGQLLAVKKTLFTPWTPFCRHCGWQGDPVASPDS